MPSDANPMAMAGEFEAAGTIVEGALVATAVEQSNLGQTTTGSHAEHDCLNCGAALAGPYCAQCGQQAHVHRTLSAIWHDILQSVLHFDGKLWRTLPMLAFKPGELTRRYVHGERAKFVSPMALFLFSIFLMFAVFSFTGGPFGSGTSTHNVSIKKDFASEAKKLDAEIAETEAKIADPKLSQAMKVSLLSKLGDLKADRNVVAFAQTGKAKYSNAETQGSDGNSSMSVLENESTGIKWLDTLIQKGGEKMVSNPNLVLYKLQSNGYKFAWLLIPLSLPFVWLATLGVRGHHFYDHAVFTTYSIAFMCLLFLLLAILSRIGIGSNVLGFAFILIPPVHLYKRLRHSYALTRPGAIVRLVLLSAFIWLVLLAFVMILFLLGFLG
ncbi:MAG: DUF3667 domain-containing protein [Sphingomonadales bacterium]|nr:DUF3667 domain-containing protein [Sphingomonadales bacterium]